MLNRRETLILHNHRTSIYRCINIRLPFHKILHKTRIAALENTKQSVRDNEVLCWRFAVSLRLFLLGLLGSLLRLIRLRQLLAIIALRH